MIPISVRLATLDDVPALESLIQASARGLREGYSAEQVEAALGNALGVDRQLIRDGTYFVAEAAQEIVGCGGWSKRKTLFGSDHGPVKDDSWLDATTDPARIRAFFVHPAWARKGVGTQLLHACETAAIKDGFRKLELAATLPGFPFYRAHGFEEFERSDVSLPGGQFLPVVRMRKSLP